MNDDKKKYNNRYEKLAAFLDEPKRSDEEEPFSSDEEARKLLYLGMNAIRPERMLRKSGKRLFNGSGRRSNRRPDAEDVLFPYGDGQLQLPLFC